jgi:hypothetical protein
MNSSEIGNVATIDEMMKELEVLERLNAMIANRYKQLSYLRALKSM